MPELQIDTTQNPEGEFTPEEQDSLEVGERLAQEQDSLLANKFSNVEELEKGYLEAQRKLSERQEPQEDPTEEPEDEGDLGEDEEGVQEFAEAIFEAVETGEWDPELVDAMKEMQPEALVEFIMEQTNQTQEQPTLSQQDAVALQNTVGGEEAYGQMIGWAAENLNQQEQALYDNVMESGNPNAMYFAMQALYYRYQDSTGYDGELLTGGAPSSTPNVFRSQAEMVAAMNDPRYENDPAYRQDVYEKAERSNLQF